MFRSIFGYFKFNTKDLFHCCHSFIQWRIARGQGGRVPPLTEKKNAKNREKEGKSQEKSGKPVV